MPVESMSMRVLIGIVQALVTPGICMAAFISSVSLSTVMPAGHWLSGFSMMVVSIMERGAGSVAVSARPIFAEHALHFGKGLDDLVRLLKDFPRLCDRDARQRGGHVQQIALLQRRHELRAESSERDHRHGNREDGHAQEQELEASARIPAPGGRSRSGIG